METLTMTGEQILRNRRRLDRLRDDRVAVWAEIAPHLDDLAAPNHIDGALVTLIAPGSKQAADLTHLDKITRIAARLPIAVDGGVTHPIARQCHDHGAGYLISGRDLLKATQTTLSTTHERRSA